MDEPAGQVEPPPTTRRGVHVRPLVELVSDWCESGDHRTCTTLWLAAHWPKPAPQHDLDGYEATIEF